MDKFELDSVAALITNEATGMNSEQFMTCLSDDRTKGLDPLLKGSLHTQTGMCQIRKNKIKQGCSDLAYFSVLSVYCI